MLTFGSLFAGVGGLDLGLERVGMKVIWQVEIDPYCQKVLAKHWPNVKRYEDVCECGKHNLETVDLICGGFPCQDVSLAGKRAGLEGKRTTLWAEFARIISELRPRWVLAENVPGLLSSDSGRFFGNVLRDLAACGYDAEWDCIPAAAVSAPHRRDRVFIVAYPKGCNARKSPERQGRQSANRRSDDSRRIKESQTETMADANEPGLALGSEPTDGRRALRQEGETLTQSGWWAVEPDVGRVADGVPSRVDRLRCLGNAVVPQVAEWIGKRIIKAEMQLRLDI